jgi:hypothetical protein
MIPPSEFHYQTCFLSCGATKCVNSASLKKIEGIMKWIFKILLILFVCGLVSCGKDDNPVIDDSDLLIGYWFNQVGSDTIFTYDRTTGLKKDTYGFAFKEGNLFVERKNVGFCGTPPVILNDYEGTWSRQDSLVDIDVPYWGGMSHYQWKIISLDRRSLKVALVKQEFQQ